MVGLSSFYHENHVRSSFFYVIGCSPGPEILLVKRFKKTWNTIQLKHLETVISDATTFNKIENDYSDTISFTLKQLEKFQPRYEFKELLNLSIIFSGRVSKKRISFRATGGMHRVR